MRDPRTRIRKLLDLALDQEGTPEGAAAARLARQMMRRHAIDLDCLDVATRRKKDPVDRLDLDLGGRALWRRRLSASIGRHCNCVVAWPRDHHKALLFGHKSDLIIAEYLYVVLCREVVEARSGCENGLPTDIEGELIPEARRQLRDFSHSAITAIEGRLTTMRDEESRLDPTGTALVRARGDEVVAWLKSRGLKFKKAPPSPYRYHPEGYAAGHRIPLHEAVDHEVRGTLPHT